MEMISKAIVDGVMQAKLEELDREPTAEHRQVARAIMTVGGYEAGNRAARRAAKAVARKGAAQARATARGQRQRASRGKVPA